MTTFLWLASKEGLTPKGYRSKARSVASMRDGEFGFGDKTGVGYNSEAKGHIPTREWYDRKFPGQFRIGHTLNAAIGQGNTKMTVLQAALLYATIGNGGKLYVPQLVRRVPRQRCASPLLPMRPVGSRSRSPRLNPRSHQA